MRILDPEPGRTAVIVVASFLNSVRGGVADGGRPRVVRDLARYLSAKGFFVRILQKGTKDCERLLEPGISVRTVRAPMAMWADLLFALRTRSLARNATLCCYATPEDGFPFFSERAFGIHHGIWWDGPRYTGLWGVLVKTIQRIRNRAMCSRLRFILCVDTNFGNHLRTLGRLDQDLAKRCIYTPNYVALDQFPMPPETRFDERFRSKKILFLRRLEPARGPLLFLDVCRDLVSSGFEFQAEICGWGSEEGLVRTKIREYGLGRHVSVSEASLDQVAQVIDRCAVSVVPSIWSEGSSLAAIESISMGVPVVATDVGGLGNVVVPGFNGYIAPANAGAIAARIRRVLSDRLEYLTLARNSVSMRRAFSLDRWFQVLDETLTAASLLGPGEASGHLAPCEEILTVAESGAAYSR